MTKPNPKSPNALQRARDYLNGLRSVYTISDNFVAHCEASVEAIFSDFDGDERARLLALTESVVRDQAEVERCEREALARVEAMKSRAALDSQAERLLSAHQKLGKAFNSGEPLAGPRLRPRTEGIDPAS